MEPQASQRKEWWVPAMFAENKVKVERSVKLMPVRALSRAFAVCVVAATLGGCASISIPFASLSGDEEPQDLRPLHTASVSETVTAPPSQNALPPELSAAMPMGTATAARDETGDRPADDLIASLPQNRASRVSLTQADLNAMGSALTHVLASDDDSGTFAWSQEATGRTGLMTPFRATSEGEQGRCRVVSVEITDGGRDTILLADACLQNETWVFLTPRAGETL